MLQRSDDWIAKILMWILTDIFIPVLRPRIADETDEEHPHYEPARSHFDLK